MPSCRNRGPSWMRSSACDAAPHQQRIRPSGATTTRVTIEPTDPSAIALPYDDPRLSYGTWPDPDAPPDYLLPPSGYVDEPALFFFAPTVIIPALRHLYRCDWQHHRLEVDVDRFNVVDHEAEERRQRPPLSETTWQHDPFHRHGVAYRDPALRAKFVPATAGGSGTRRDFRGYEERVAQPGTLRQAGPEVQVYRPPASEQRQPTVFEGTSRAPDVRAQAERGRQSLQSAPPPARQYAPRPAPPGTEPGSAPRR